MILKSTDSHTRHLYIFKETAETIEVVCLVGDILAHPLNIRGVYSLSLPQALVRTHRYTSILIVLLPK